MDDFASNLATFTPEYTAAMRSAARRINPALEFFPVLYRRDYVPAFLSAYAGHFDGAIFPYTVDFDDFEGVAATLQQIRAAVEPFGLHLILMVYATKMSVAQYPPSAPYVAGALRAGLAAAKRGEIRGVVTYAMAKEFQVDACGFAHHLNLVVPSETPTRVGDFVSATQAVRIDARADTHQLRFFEQDSYPAGTAGYHFKQLLVNGKTVWSVDVAADPALTWTEHTFDLTPYVKGTSRATIAFRLYDEKGVSNFGVRMSIAGMSASPVRVYVLGQSASAAVGRVFMRKSAVLRAISSCRGSRPKWLYRNACTHRPRPSNQLLLLVDSRRPSNSTSHMKPPRS